MKINIKKLILLMLLLLMPAEASWIVYSGTIRTGIQYHDTYDEVGQDSALGANLHLETTELSNIKIGMGVDISQVLFGKNDAAGITFFSSDADSYILLSESYLQATFDKSRLKVGRQYIDTPFADSDDIGMVANSFEAFTLSNHTLTDMTITYLYLKSMSGVDAAIPEDFSAINGGSGVHAVGMLYEALEDISYTAWIYHLPHIASYWYGETRYSSAYHDIDYQLSAQVVWQDFKKEKSAKIVGFMGSFGYKDVPLSLHLAYNKSYDEVAENGFGGGPFFANDEHLTLADVGADGEMMVYGLEWDASEALQSGVNIGLYGAMLEDAKKSHGREFDIVVNYSYDETLTFDAIYSTLDNSKISGDRFKNLRVFAKYSF
jgi:hypothetical protein